MSTPSARQTLSFLKQRFQEVGIQLNRRHGQNFLIDLNLLALLVDSAQLTPNDMVLEVGTGTGAVTAMVAARAAHVVTVEIDPQLFQLASEELIDFDNVTMLCQDALKNKNQLHPAVLEAVWQRLAESPGRQFKLVANLPYNVATPVISNLLALDDPPVTMTVTIQKELADRIVARPSTKDYGALSVWVQSQCHVEILRVLRPEVFWPRPKVHSAILQIRFDPAMRARVADLGFFHEFARAMFFQRRKFLRSVLASAYKGRLDKAAVDALLAQHGLGPTTRAEALDLDTMLLLCDAVRRQIGG